MVNAIADESRLGLPPSYSGGAISKEQAALVGERAASQRSSELRETLYEGPQTQCLWRSRASWQLARIVWAVEMTNP